MVALTISSKHSDHVTDSPTPLSTRVFPPHDDIARRFQRYLVADNNLDIPGLVACREHDACFMRHGFV